MEKRRLLTYRPYSKQIEFHEAGRWARERLFMALNQGGKTLAGGMEASMHVTGWYPEWWTGRRFDRAVHCWVSGISNEQTRDNAQRMLLGRNEDGTGTIPADRILDISHNRGIADFADVVIIRHESGENSTINFKSYEMGRKKWQGETLDFIWFDEEPPIELYSEGLARITATRGFVFITFTPLLGMTEVVEQFYPAPNHPSRAMVRMDIEDVAKEPHGHITSEQVDEIVSSYPPHEREARSQGIPTQGSGRVFPIAESVIREHPFDIPPHWARICGLDFGWDHPTAAVWMAWDRDSDVIHLYDCYKQSEETPVVHAAALRQRGEWIPVAWPHDGYQHDKGSGMPLARTYLDQNVRMIPQHAQFQDGGFGVEAGIMQILDRMKTGRFKVFAHCEPWFEEFRAYHRDDGKIVKRKDDLMSAMRYGVMCLRFARTQDFEITRMQTTAGMDYNPVETY